MEDRVYLTHVTRGDDICPRCAAALVWRKVGERKYTPCDKIPVLCARTPEGREHVVYRGELIGGVQILRRSNPRALIGAHPFYALEPHVFTCDARLGKVEIT